MLLPFLPADVYGESVHKATNQTQVSEPKAADIFAARRHLYESIGQMTQIPWYRLAAIDQYERTITRAHPKDRKHPDRLTGFYDLSGLERLAESG